MSIGLAFALWFAEVLAIATLAATPRGARAGVWLAIALLPLPAFVVHAWPPPMFVLCVAMLFAVFRGADLAVDRTIATWPRRVAHLLSLLDQRRMTRVPRHFDARALGKIVVAGAVCVAAVWVIGVAYAFDDWRFYALRWFVGGAPLPFAVFACADGVLAFVLAASGRRMPPVNRAPYLATSLSDFWARRWNSVINTLLRDHVYKPVSHRGALAAMTATFVASAALHAYLIGMLLGPGATLAWTLFFIAQAGLMWIERHLHVRRWRPAYGHAWTLGSLMVLYPLFIEPLLAVLERV